MAAQWALSLLLAGGAVFRVVAHVRGVEVSQRLDTHILEFRAEGSFAAPPEAVRAELLNYDDTTALAKEVSENRVLARGDHFVDVYQRLKLPIVSDRDYTLHVTWGESAGVLWLRIVNVNDRGPPPRPGVVRVPLHEGTWQLARAADGTTRARYSMRIDLGGALPPWLARDRAADSLPDFFERVRQQLQRGRGGLP